jgi:hypothetical protein
MPLVVIFGLSAILKDLDQFLQPVLGVNIGKRQDRRENESIVVELLQFVEFVRANDGIGIAAGERIAQSVGVAAIVVIDAVVVTARVITTITVVESRLVVAA